MHGTVSNAVFESLPSPRSNNAPDAVGLENTNLLDHIRVDELFGVVPAPDPCATSDFLKLLTARLLPELLALFPRHQESVDTVNTPEFPDIDSKPVNPTLDT